MSNTLNLQSPEAGMLRTRINQGEETLSSQEYALLAHAYIEQNGWETDGGWLHERHVEFNARTAPPSFDPKETEKSLEDFSKECSTIVASGRADAIERLKDRIERLIKGYAVVFAETKPQVAQSLREHPDYPRQAGGGSGRS